MMIIFAYKEDDDDDKIWRPVGEPSFPRQVCDSVELESSTSPLQPPCCDYDDDFVNAMIKFYKLPYKLSYMKCNIKVETNINLVPGDADKAIFAEHKKISAKILRHSMIQLVDYNVCNKHLVSMKRIEFTVSIEILEIYDQNKEVVNKLKWSQYGVIDSV